MQRTARERAVHSIFAFLTLVGMGGGCVAIYSFEDFEKKPPRPCKTTADCPMANECGRYVCEGQICKIPNPVVAGTLTTGNTRGDCLSLTCDGKGNIVAQLDALDVPNDGDICTIDTCEGGKPTNKLAPVNTPCGPNADVGCNAAGACTGCFVGADCGEDNACTTWTCEKMVCIKNIKAIGTIVDNAIPGDCRAIVCNAIGETEEAIVNSDAPSDGNECTTDACTIDGKEDHQPANVDTPCGTCGVCDSSGSCSACDMTVFDCYNDRCIPKPHACEVNGDCPSGYCVDKFCCDSECGSTCMACSNDKTGVPSGICAFIPDGKDPDGECGMKNAGDTCRQGKCGCENGMMDGDESGADCGGTCSGCTGKWNCAGDATCNGAGSTAACCGLDCIDCKDQTADCQNLATQTCALGAAPRKLTVGLVNLAGCFPTFTACRSITCNCVP